MDKFIERLYKRYNNTMLEDDIIYKSEDFKKFASYMKKQFKDAAILHGFELDSFNVGHYDVSGFFKKGEKYIYFSYSEPRHSLIQFDSNSMMQSFLYRTAQHNKDYTGGSNNFSNLPDLMDNIERLFNRM